MLVSRAIGVPLCRRTRCPDERSLSGTDPQSLVQTDVATNNPQQQQMADESMLRCLESQAAATWPQEVVLLDDYRLPDTPAILDLGCGPGEISERLLEHFGGCSVIGLDLEVPHLERARVRCKRFGSKAEFRLGDAVELDLEADLFDLSVCRHLLQAVPSPERVVANLVRVTKPGGTVHVVAEDYAMMHFAPTTLDIDDFWHRGPISFAAQTGTDLRSGRKMFNVFSKLGLRNVRVDYIVVDSMRVPRETFAQIWLAWRDGYAQAISEHTELTYDHVVACFNEMISCIRDPKGYAVWQLPVISGVV